MTKVVTIPVGHCDTFSAEYSLLRIRFPFGLPTLFGVEPFALLGNAQSALSGLAPILQVVDCVLKVIALVKAVPKLVAIPPDFTAFNKALAGIVDCAGVTLPNLVPGLALPNFLLFIKDLLSLVIALLKEILALYGQLLGGEAHMGVLLASSDPLLVEQGKCLQKQHDAMKASIAFKVEGIKGFMTIINLMLTIAQQQPIDMSAASFAPAAIQDVIKFLSVFRDAIPELP